MKIFFFNVLIPSHTVIDVGHKFSLWEPTKVKDKLLIQMFDRAQSFNCRFDIINVTIGVD